MKFKFSNKLLIKKIKILIPFMIFFFVLSFFVIMSKLNFDIEKLYYAIIPMVLPIIILTLIIYFLNKRFSRYYVEINGNLITLNAESYLTMRIDNDTKLTIIKDKKKDLVTGLFIENKVSEMNLKEYERLDELYEKILPYLNKKNIEYNKAKKKKKGEVKAIFLSILASTSVLVLGVIVDIIFARRIKDLGLIFLFVFMMIYNLCSYFFDFPVYLKGRWQDKKDKLINVGIWFILFIFFQIRFYYL